MTRPKNRRGLSAPQGRAISKGAEESKANRVRPVVDLAIALVEEVQAFVQEQRLVNGANVSRTFDANAPISFYAEVKQFEVALIETALERSRGNQLRAARSIGLKPTTLNAKIKQYAIAVERFNGSRIIK